MARRTKSANVPISADNSAQPYLSQAESSSPPNVEGDTGEEVPKKYPVTKEWQDRVKAELKVRFGDRGGQKWLADQTGQSPGQINDLLGYGSNAQDRDPDSSEYVAAVHVALGWAAPLTPLESIEVAELGRLLGHLPSEIQAEMLNLTSKDPATARSAAAAIAKYMTDRLVKAP